MTAPTPDQVLHFIIRFKRANDGIAPTVREIQAGCNISSTSVVDYQLDRLEKSGRIIRLGEYKRRQIQVVGGQWTFEGQKTQ